MNDRTQPRWDRSLPRSSPTSSGGFSFSETELDVCRCLLEEGDSTPRDVAERLGPDRTTVGAHLNRLVDIGVVEADERLLGSGGCVNAYSLVGAEEIAKRLRRGLYAWTAQALEMIEDIGEERPDLNRSDDVTQVC